MRTLIHLIWMALLLSSCSSTGGLPLQHMEIELSQWVLDTEVLEIETATSAIPSSTIERERYQYAMGPGDVINLSVWGDSSLSGEYRIGPDGDITVPLFGTISIAGFTRDQAAEMLVDRLGEHYIDPHVVVIVSEFNNNNVFLLGAFMFPGEYKLENQATLLQALSFAQGFTETADRTGLTITRGDNTVIRINLDELLHGGDLGLNVKLKPGDVLFLPENSMRIVHVLGEVAKPGMVPVGRGLDLLRAVAGAGGITENAVPEEVRVLRRYGDKVRIFTVNVKSIYDEGALMANIQLQPEDIIFVPTRGLAKLNYVLRQLSPSFSTIFAVDQITELTNND
jgi:polysaccharide export outer membrane protein